MAASDPGVLSWTAEENGFSKLPFTTTAPIRWKPDPEEGYILVYDPNQDRWRRIRDHCAPVLDAFDQGMDLAQAAQHAKDAMPRRPGHHIRLIIRKTTSYLLRWEMAQLTLPDPPAIFDDRYEVLGELGSGGIGVLWRCYDTQDDQEVAIKHAWNWRGPFEKRESYLRDEAAVMAAIDPHPNIAGFRGTFHHDGRFHLVRELLSGPPLDQRAHEGLEPDQRVRIVRQILSSLLHLKDHGYLCLDVKTDNYMLDGPEDRIVMMDLGFSREMVDGQVPVGKAMPGTRSFQAPELAYLYQADERCTVYTLAKIVWQLATGKAPVPRAHLDSYVEQHTEDLEILEAADPAPWELELFTTGARVLPRDRLPSLDACDRLVPGA